jgi:hypothetical protein
VRTTGIVEGSGTVISGEGVSLGEARSVGDPTGVVAGEAVALAEGATGVSLRVSPRIVMAVATATTATTVRAAIGNRALIRLRKKFDSMGRV